MATTDISEYTSAILSQKKGETVRDAIINAVKVISGAVSGSRSASTLNGESLTNFVVNYYDPNGDKPFAVSLNRTLANVKREVDKINYGDPDGYYVTQTELGPYSTTGVNNNHYMTHSLDRLEVTRREIYEAINEAWRNTPSGAHGSDEYLVLDSDPFEDYPHYISLIGSGEGYALRCSERTEPITENGTYTADEGTGWTKVTVNVSDKNIGPHTSTITADGTYTALSYGKDGFSFVNVQVPVASPDSPTYVPEDPYNQTAWYGGGTVNNKWPVLFYLDHEGGILLDEQYVTNGSNATFGGDWDQVTKQGYYFIGWSPNPTNITARTICVAQWRKLYQVDVSTGEISNAWAQIAQNKGADVEVGEWKTLDFGTVTIPTDNGLVSQKIGKRMMVKVEGVNSEKGTTSTWISLDVLPFPYGHFWRQDTKQKVYEDCISSVDEETGYYSEHDISFSDSDLFAFLNGGSANSIFMNLPAALVSEIKRVSKKNIALRVKGGDTESTKENIYCTDSANVIETIQHKFWIPSSDEIFGKKTSTVSLPSYLSNASATTNYTGGGSRITYVHAYKCSDDDYSSFFFNYGDWESSSVCSELNWHANWKTTNNLYYNDCEYLYPYNSSSSSKTQRESGLYGSTDSVRNNSLFLTRDIAQNSFSDISTYETNIGMILSGSNGVVNSALIPMIPYNFKKGGTITGYGVFMANAGYGCNSSTLSDKNIYFHIGFCL